MEEEYGIYSTGNYIVSTPEGDISIYILDTSLRSFSSTQLSWLQEALEKDDIPFKILVRYIIPALILLIMITQLFDIKLG